MNKMQALSAALRAEEEEKNAKKSGTTRKASGGDNASYPFWDIKEGKTASVRFLPDADPDNQWFWKEREIIKLPFDGIVGGEYPTNDAVEVTVPCMDMFAKNTCPIIQATRSWWNDPNKVSLARQYYKKRSWLYQGFVVSSPLVEEEAPANPIRRFVINKSIHEIIRTSMMDSEMEDLPVDYQGGRDFKIAKTMKGGPDGVFANYGTSSWSMKVRPLSEDEMIAIDQFGLWNLADFRGKQPDATGVDMIKAMFQDSVDGKPFDYASYGEFYKAYSPKGRRSSDPDAVSNHTPAASSKTVVQGHTSDDSDVADTSSDDSDAAKSTQATLARLKARVQSSK